MGCRNPFNQIAAVCSPSFFLLAVAKRRHPLPPATDFKRRCRCSFVDNQSAGKDHHLITSLRLRRLRRRRRGGSSAMTTRSSTAMNLRELVSRADFLESLLLPPKTLCICSSLPGSPAAEQNSVADGESAHSKRRLPFSKTSA